MIGSSTTVEVFRTFSPELVNLFIRHPSVRPHVQEGDNLPDSKMAVMKTENIFLASEVGVGIFLPCGEKAWDVHVVVIDEGRGKQAVEFGREAMRQIFTVYGANVCYTDTPLRLRNGRWFARQCGFTSLGADVTNDRALYSFVATDITNKTSVFTFTYRII